MVIKTAVKPRGPSLPSKRPFGIFYEAAKQGLRTLGLYEDIKQYDPGYYYERYSYKTPKRVRSKIAQELQKRFRPTQRRYVTQRYQFDQERCKLRSWNNWNPSNANHCESGEYSTLDSQY